MREIKPILTLLITLTTTLAHAGVNFNMSKQDGIIRTKEDYIMYVKFIKSEGFYDIMSDSEKKRLEEIGAKYSLPPGDIVSSPINTLKNSDEAIKYGELVWMSNEAMQELYAKIADMERKYEDEYWSRKDTESINFIKDLRMFQLALSVAEYHKRQAEEADFKKFGAVNVSSSIPVKR